MNTIKRCFQISFLKERIAFWKRGGKESERGYSLVEVSIIMALVAIVAVAALSVGQKMIVQARLSKTRDQVALYIRAISDFKDLYRVFPGQYEEAGEKFGGTKGISGLSSEGLKKESPSGLAWTQMKEAGLIDAPEKKTSAGVIYPAARIGGGFSVEYHEDGAFLVLGAEREDTTRGGLLSKVQTAFFQKDFPDAKAEQVEGKNYYLMFPIKEN